MDQPQPPILISEEAIRARVAELAEQISRDAAGVELLPWSACCAGPSSSWPTWCGA